MFGLSFFFMVSSYFQLEQRLLKTAKEKMEQLSRALSGRKFISGLFDIPYWLKSNSEKLCHVRPIIPSVAILGD